MSNLTEKRVHVRGLLNQLLVPGQDLDQDIYNIERLKRMYPSLQENEIQGFLHIAALNLDNTGKNLAVISSLLLLYDILQDQTKEVGGTNLS